MSERNGGGKKLGGVCFRCKGTTFFSHSNKFTKKTTAFFHQNIGVGMAKQRRCFKSSTSEAFLYPPKGTLAGSS